MSIQLPRILMADDHELMAAGICRLLKQDFQVLDVVTDGHKLLKAAAREKPEVILLDISMPGLDGLEVTRHLRRSGSRAAILILTMHEEIAYARAAFAAGASGYLVKSSAPWELLQAIDDVLNGRRYVTPVVASEVMRFPTPEPTSLELTLSPREVEVAKKVALGLENVEIAHQLEVAEVTIRTHFRRILQKLQLRNRVELTRHVLSCNEEGLDAEGIDRAC